MLGNKEIMAKNIRRYMEQKGVNSTEVCRALGFKQNTFSNWLNADYYPRIDKIEMMANYFGVPKSALVEEHKATIEWDIQNDMDLRRLVEIYHQLTEIQKQEGLSYFEYLHKK